MNVIKIGIGDFADPGPMFPELVGKVSLEGTVTHVGILERGTKQGATALVVIVEVNGRNVSVSLTAAALESIAAAVRGAEQRWAERTKGN